MSDVVVSKFASNARPERDALILELGDEGTLSWGEIGRIAGGIGHKHALKRYHELDQARSDRKCHPSGQVRAKAAVKRNCMTCGHLFYSAGPHNRMCSECRISTTSVPDYAITGVRMR